MKLAGKVAIVTGASRGLGRAIAFGLAREGADIVIAARTEAEGKLAGTIHETAARVQSLGRRALALRCDVTQEQEVAEMVRKTVSELGRVDILVNNAAAAYPGPFLDMPLKRWDVVMRVNLGGTVQCIKAVLPRMVEQRSGSIVNISSTAATIQGANPSGLAYAVSKAAIERFTTALAAEVAQYNIAVNCVKPSWWVNTEGARFWNPDAKWQWDSPERMVASVIFLAKQDTKGVTGVVALAEELCAAYRLV